jgi:hypothetical protein
MFSSEFYEEVDYMGSRLSCNDKGVELSADKKNIECMKDISVPESEKHLRAFIGMSNWLSDFIPNLHLELGPFYDLLSKLKKEPGKKFSEFWNNEMTDLFKAVIEKISNPTTLSVPNYDDQFNIECDSSGYGYGAYLYQEGKVIGYASKALPKLALNYDNIHRETACVLWAIEKFSRFFCCSPFPTRIYTDNRVTSFIKSSTSSKLKRWRSILDSYNIVLEHRAGSKMLVSDALSRLIDRSENRISERDISDEMLHETVIASQKESSTESSEILDELELLQMHQNLGHCSSDRLAKISGQKLGICETVVKRCFGCCSRQKVKQVKQILGTLPDPAKKNGLWMIDLVYWNNKKYLSILDRSTRFMSVIPVVSRHHKSIAKSLEHEFSKLGVPEKISADREFVSEHLGDLFERSGIEFLALTRESLF